MPSRREEEGECFDIAGSSPAPPVPAPPPFGAGCLVSSPFVRKGRVPPSRVLWLFPSQRGPPKVPVGTDIRWFLWFLSAVPARRH